jgi:hypothetical protein
MLYSMYSPVFITQFLHSQAIVQIMLLCMQVTSGVLFPTWVVVT